ncbi:MAG: hypothetical protein IPJ43_02655 [Saprospiraceae bacterium]|nr:hypothetical protein [Saprospiraceae bacterium]
MRFDLKRLYDLLPANLRTKDSLVGLEMLGKNPEDWNDDIYGPIKALLSIIADEAVSIEENIDQLYDDMFIETCSEWVVPYIGDLIGYRGLSRIPNAKYNNRAEVANTITYRRKKGTISVVEQLANDVTGWKASVVEYFMHLATSQYMNHIRPNNVSISKINGPNWQQLAFANTPFDPMPKCVDVRNIQSNRGKYNIPNIGIFLWRIRSYSVTNRPPFMVNDKQYKFDFLGKDIPLYNLSTPEDSFSSMANRENISLPINRREMFEKKDDFYGNGKSVTIYYDGVEINAENVCVCILGNEDGAWINLPIEASKVAIDPLLGRIAFSENKDASKIRVSYHYGYAGDIGSGEFERDQFFEAPALEINETNDFDTSLGDVLSSAKELIISDSSVYKKKVIHL